MSYTYKYTIPNLKFLSMFHTFIETIPGLPTEVLNKNIQVQNKITDGQPVFLNNNLIIKFSEKLSLYPHFINTGQRVLYRNAKYM